VPNYERMIDTVAETLHFIDTPAPTILDLGVGTGALASRCLEVCPDAHLIGLDVDPEMLALARARLLHHDRVDLRVGDFLREELPMCDVTVACISLHHVPTPDVKRNFYAACRRALKPGGLLVSADCYPNRDARVAANQHQQWLAHIEQSYSRAEAEGYLTSWAAEDVYFALSDELAWLQGAGFTTEVIWRVGGFAVVAARR
jgi:tRNA (cmo5U34)-methyltransferase